MYLFLANEDQISVLKSKITAMPTVANVNFGQYISQITKLRQDVSDLKNKQGMKGLKMRNVRYIL